MFQGIRAEVLDHRNPVNNSSPSAAANAVAAATLNIDEILELCADYERQIDEEKVKTDRPRRIVEHSKYNSTEV